MERYFNINYEFDKLAVLDRINNAVKNDSVQYICVADANILQQVATDLNYRDVVNGSMFSICDSSWVPLFLKHIYGIDRKHYCGSMIFKDIIERKQFRQFFMGTSTDVLNALQVNLSKIDLSIKNMEFYELPFCDVDSFDYQSIAKKVNEDNPDIIWVALGAPKQEIFMNRLKPHLKRGVMIAVGAAFKFFSGLEEKRAPQWVQKLHLEFAYRLLEDPKKQFARCRKIVSVLPQILKEEKARKKLSHS